MSTVSIQLLLSGDNVTLDEGEQFANFIGFAVRAAGSSLDGRKIEVGQVTLLQTGKVGDVSGG